MSLLAVPVVLVAGLPIDPFASLPAAWAGRSKGAVLVAVALLAPFAAGLLGEGAVDRLARYALIAAIASRLGSTGAAARATAVGLGLTIAVAAQLGLSRLTDMPGPSETLVGICLTAAFALGQAVVAELHLPRRVAT